MTIWAIVPVKPLRRGKSRLADALSEAERTELNRTFLVHTLQTLRELPEITATLVVSRDPAALALAREHGARTFQEDGAPQLNTALRRATGVAQVYASRGVLIVPADLPLLGRDELRAIIARAVDPPVVVIAPDRHRQGTNALLMCPAGLIGYDFGVNSFQRHCDRAVQAGARLEICELPGVALDVDLPEDLELVKTKGFRVNG